MGRMLHPQLLLPIKRLSRSARTDTLAHTHTLKTSFLTRLLTDSGSGQRYEEGCCIEEFQDLISDINDQSFKDFKEHTCSCATL